MSRRQTLLRHWTRAAWLAAIVGLAIVAVPRTALQAQDAVATVATAGSGVGAADATHPTREYLLKTAFVFNFARYTTWPPPSPDGPFYFCILGTDGFGAAAKYLAGQRLRTRNMDVRFHTTNDDLTNCQLVYVTRPLAGILDTLLPRLHAHRMLTVSDIPDFAARGGILGLKIVDNHVRFEANAAAAKGAGLRLSAQLLRLADIVG
jgi:YfiR/HmsC-like